jgi:hypothetical protein
VNVPATAAAATIVALEKGLLTLVPPRGLAGGAIAIGVAALEQGNITTWYVVDCLPTGVTVRKTVALESVPAAEHKLGADVAVSATRSIWAKAANASSAEFCELVDALEFSVSGHMAYFVRHLPAVVYLMKAFGAVVVALP